MSDILVILLAYNCIGIQIVAHEKFILFFGP